MNFTFDASLRIGDLLIIASFFGSAALAWGTLKGRMDRHDLQLTYINASIENLELEAKDNFKLLLNQQRTELTVDSLVKQLTLLQSEVADMRRGRGFIIEDRRPPV